VCCISPRTSSVSYFVLVTQPANGIVKIVDNQVVYLPARGFLGVDNFTYTISDGRGGKSTAAVAIVVLG